MFERYNEKARRCIFFARYEASHYGSPYIESEHLLLGLMREGKALSRVLGIDDPNALRAQIDASSEQRENTLTSVDIPLSGQCKRILTYGAEEALRLDRSYIGPEHLMLGLLRETGCFAARLLSQRDIDLDKARERIAKAGKELAAAGSTGSGSNLGVPGAAGARRPASAPNVRLIEAGAAEILCAFPSAAPIPRIGDSILIRNGEAPSASWKVRDVVWEIASEVGDAGSYALEEVKVFVVKQA